MLLLYQYLVQISKQEHSYFVIYTVFLSLAATGYVVVLSDITDDIYLCFLERKRRRNRNILVYQSTLSLAKFEESVAYSMCISYFLCRMYSFVFLIRFCFCISAYIHGSVESN